MLGRLKRKYGGWQRLCGIAIEGREESANGAADARKKKEGTMNRKAVQIRQGWTTRGSKRLNFCVRQVCLAVQVVLVLS